MPWLKRGINRFIPSVIWQPRPQVPETLAALPDDVLILDLGAGGRQIRAQAIGVDFLPVQNTKVVADIHRLAFIDECVDAVFCTGVLEHIENPSQALMEMMRVLKPGGIVHIEVPFMQPYHADPNDYWRWTLDGLQLFAEQHGILVLRRGTHLGPTSAMNALIIAYFQSWVRNRYVRKGIELVLSPVLWPLKYLDLLLPSDGVAMPSGVYLVGAKKR